MERSFCLGSKVRRFFAPNKEPLILLTSIKRAACSFPSYSAWISQMYQSLKFDVPLQYFEHLSTCHPTHGLANQIEIAKNYGTVEWHEDLKLCLMQAGVDDKSVVFLFNDTQVRAVVLCWLQAHVPSVLCSF